MKPMLAKPRSSISHVDDAAGFGRLPRQKTNSEPLAPTVSKPRNFSSVPSKQQGGLPESNGGGGNAKGRQCLSVFDTLATRKGSSIAETKSRGTKSLP